MKLTWTATQLEEWAPNMRDWVLLVQRHYEMLSAMDPREVRAVEAALSRIRAGSLPVKSHNH